MLAKFGADKSEDLLYLPAVAIRSAQEIAAFPLRLNTYRLMSRPMGGGKDQPWLLEQPAVHLQASWEGWVEIHPQTPPDWVLKRMIWCGLNRPKAE